MAKCESASTLYSFHAVPEKLLYWLVGLVLLSTLYSGVVVKISGSRLRLVNFFYARKASDSGVGDTGFRLVRAREIPTSSMRRCSCCPRGVCSRGLQEDERGNWSQVSWVCTDVLKGSVRVFCWLERVSCLRVPSPPFIAQGELGVTDEPGMRRSKRDKLIQVKYNARERTEFQGRRPPLQPSAPVSASAGRVRLPSDPVDDLPSGCCCQA